MQVLSKSPTTTSNFEWWERHGTVLASCKTCGYEGEAQWDIERGESGEWTCLQCCCRWPFLDFDRLWIGPKRSIEYHGCIEPLAAAHDSLIRDAREVVRVWRTCDDDPRHHVLYSDPEARRGDDFLWGFRRYSVDEQQALNLARSILYDFGNSGFLVGK